VSQFYWEGARHGALLLQRCRACGWYLHPPDPTCPRCLSDGFDHVAASGRGTIFAFTIARQAFHQSFADHVPYVLALVELEEQAGLRVLSNIIESDHAALADGAPVELTFEARGQWKLPQFRLRRGPTP